MEREKIDSWADQSSRRLAVDAIREQWREQFDRCRRFTALSRLSKLVRSPLGAGYRHGLSLCCDRLNLKLRKRVRTFFGEKMTVVLPEGVSHFLFCNRFFEESSTWWLLHRLEPESVFLDVGAHLGYFSALASKLVGEKGSVHAFEPTPATFALLKENTRECSNTSLHRVALWSHRTKMQFRDYGLKFSGLNSFTSPRLPEGPHSRELFRSDGQHQELIVETQSLDRFLEQSGLVPDFVKVDAEGSEYAILQGMQRTLLSFRPLLLIEVGDFGRGAHTSNQLLRFLFHFGYQALEFEAGRERRHQPRESYPPSNLLFVPVEQVR